MLHRIWKNDEFRIGAGLNFALLNSGPVNVVFASRDAVSPAIALHTSLLSNETLPKDGGSNGSTSSFGSFGVRAPFEASLPSYTAALGVGM